MTKKADFNAEEWEAIAEAPMLAGMRVAAAARGGTISESLAMARVYPHAREQHGESELLDELVRTPPTVDTQRLRAGGDLTALTTERLGDALRILDAKATPEEREAYRRFVLGVAQAAAHAHKEGGLLGIGGEEVSGAEQAALDDIRAALGLAAGA